MQQQFAVSILEGMQYKVLPDLYLHRLCMIILSAYLDLQHPTDKGVSNIKQDCQIPNPFTHHG